MSIIMTSMMIVTNCTGFVISYMSKDAGYIPGILIGIGLMFISLMIPRDYVRTKTNVGIHE